MDGRVDGKMDGRVDGKMDGRVDGWTHPLLQSAGGFYRDRVSPIRLAWNPIVFLQPLTYVFLSLSFLSTLHLPGEVRERGRGREGEAERERQRGRGREGGAEREGQRERGREGAADRERQRGRGSRGEADRE